MLFSRKCRKTFLDLLNRLCLRPLRCVSLAFSCLFNAEWLCWVKKPPPPQLWEKKQLLWTKSTRNHIGWEKSSVYGVCLLGTLNRTYPCHAVNKRVLTQQLISQGTAKVLRRGGMHCVDWGRVHNTIHLSTSGAFECCFSPNGNSEQHTFLGVCVLRLFSQQSSTGPMQFYGRTQTWKGLLPKPAAPTGPFHLCFVALCAWKTLLCPSTHDTLP